MKKIQTQIFGTKGPVTDDFFFQIFKVKKKHESPLFFTKKVHFKKNILRKLRKMYSVDHKKNSVYFKAHFCKKLKKSKRSVMLFFNFVKI
jgi:hypothetical protein